MSIRELFKEIKKSKVALLLLSLLCLIAILGIYAPLFASSKPLLIHGEEGFRAPLFYALFDSTFFTKKIDLFFNVLMFSLPIYFILIAFIKKKRRYITLFFIFLQLVATVWVLENNSLNFEKRDLNLKNQQTILKPLIVQSHWQENAIASKTPFFTHAVRVNGKSLWSALFFGIRTSMAVAIFATALAFFIGTTLGLLAGYFGKKVDFILGRLIEVWEAMPTLFMLLFLASFSASQNLSFVIIILAIFSWTSIARLVRLEVLKQKSYPYVDVLKGFNLPTSAILLKHILPAALPQLLTLMPFALVGAITYEAALSFLGIGDRQSCSIGLLIDEARMAYPMQPSLFWPPAILMIIILLSLVWLGDLIRKILEPKESVI